ncbi:ATP-binding protein [Sporohalobacter salinus]|uniref:ATP-binding protein n=1 Tax=Sporohalobacter salinus TaxID=1494606 RepID=UPI001961AF6B|nr:ATP-binding protein [Sporohalobacter salinus]MBM7624089.1 putative kinase [Sporohalobacter salinus]
MGQDKELYMTIGLPRSGKSTWIEKNAEDGVVVSADSLRKKVYGQRFWEDGEGLLWWIRGIFLRELLEQGVKIYIDETNVTKERRSKIIGLAHEYGYEVIGIWIGTDKESCLNRCREISIEEYKLMKPAIEQMAATFKKPTKDEGFKEIIKDK